MSDPKRHHYLPESYLSGFTAQHDRQGKLWIYDIQQRRIRIQTPVNTGVQGYYNAVEMPNGTRDFGVEKWLAGLEGDFATTLVKIESREALDEKDRATLGLFAAFQMMRGPGFEREVGGMMESALRMAGKVAFENEERAKIMLEKFEQDTGRPLGLSPAEMVEMMNSDSISMPPTHRNESLRIMVNLAPNTAKRLIRFDWVFLHAPKGREFITSDKPFVVYPPPNLSDHGIFSSFGYATSGTRKLLPLSAQVALIMFDPGSAIQHQDVTEAEVRFVNRNVAVDAYRFLICGNENLLRSLVRNIERAERNHRITWGGSRLLVDGKRLGLPFQRGKNNPARE